MVRSFKFPKRIIFALVMRFGNLTHMGKSLAMIGSFHNHRELTITSYGIEVREFYCTLANLLIANRQCSSVHASDNSLVS